MSPLTAVWPQPNCLASVKLGGPSVKKKGRTTLGAQPASAASFLLSVCWPLLRSEEVFTDPLCPQASLGTHWRDLGGPP